MSLLIARFWHCSEQLGGAGGVPATSNQNALMDLPGSAIEEFSIGGYLHYPWQSILQDSLPHQAVCEASDSRC